jgi:beta-lactamase class A
MPYRLASGSDTMPEATDVGFGARRTGKTVAQATATDQATFTAAMDAHFGTLSGVVGVMVHDLRTGNALTYNHEEVFPTASTLKVPLLYELFRQAEAGMIDLTERVTLSYANRVPGSGVLQDLDEGLQPTIRDLAELMIIVSDNWATDLIYERIGKERVAATLRELGMRQTHIPLTIHELFCTLAEVDPASPEATYELLRETLKSSKAADDNLGYSADPRNDVSSPADMVRLMVLIHEGRGLSDTGREGMLKILKDQNFNTIIPARLPDDEKIETAHKTGSLRGIRNDVGLVYAPKASYAVAFMSKGQKDIPEVIDQMARASRWIWDALATDAEA